ncbi:MAG: galactokinase [Ruminococcaceae bacterium]|nr:galactokinase [Oscillospiraceae bacterium]
MNITRILNELQSDAFLPLFRQLYGTSDEALARQKKRYTEAVNAFARLYPSRSDISIFSAPGRTEIGGNHTDHQHGRVLAAAVDLDIIGVVSFHNEGVLRVKSEGYDAFEVDLSDLEVGDRRGNSASIVRGIVRRFTDMGVSVGGFDLYSVSDVPGGSGISSSAAFETLIGTIIDRRYNDGKAGAVEIARIGQYAENVYFGKNSGLMDQMVSSVGGLVAIDFLDPQKPVINSFRCDFERIGYCVIITDTGGSHADLTGDYTAVRAEMEQVAAQFGKTRLREVGEAEFYDAIPKLREHCPDRALLRAIHFFEDDRRAAQEADALMCGDIDRFLRLVNSSGESSANLLQNLYSCSAPQQQAIPLALEMSRRILGGSGAVRVHGGGFAGTIQAFVPLDMAGIYEKEMERIFGENACMRLRIRPAGGFEMTSQQ